MSQALTVNKLKIHKTTFYGVLNVNKLEININTCCRLHQFGKL